MHEFPHHYYATASAKPEGEVSITNDNLETIYSAPPIEFDGPGNRWSPEEMLIAAIADCFVLSFRAIARASKLSWSTLECEVTGTLDRTDRKTRFTEFAVNAVLAVPPGGSEEKAQQLLEKAEASCLITNSLSGVAHLTASVVEDS